MQEYEVINADCSDAMADMEPDSVDAIVTDPPYGIAFMGAKWDSFNGGSGKQTVDERKAEGKRYADENKGAPRYGNSHGKRVTRDEMVAFQDAMTPVFREALRVAKPGAYLLCFGGTRTFHRMACAIEDAGWNVKDCIMWVYGSGFPHGMNVAKAIDKASGYVGEVVGTRMVDVGMQGGHMHAGRKHDVQQQEVRELSDKAKDWDGWNTQIKPAWESVIVAQKVPSIQEVARHLNEVEECLYRLHASSVENNSIHTQTKYEEGMDDSARGSVEMRAGDAAELNIHAGKAGDTSFQAGTSESTSEVVNIALSMTSSWKSTLADAYEMMSKCTTEMATSLTTDLRTWSCCLLQTTPDSIIEAATSQNGSSAHVSDVERLFYAVREKLNAIRILTVPASATWDDDIRPAWEPIVVAQKPMNGTIVNNVLTYGTGAINVDACRIGFESRTYKGMSAKQPEQAGVFRDDNWVPKDIEVSVTGRYPANLVHDGSDEVVELFPESKGQQANVTGSEPSRPADGVCYGDYVGRHVFAKRGDSGSAARFFYCAKASKKDRGVGNDHPTCKPTALMQWLVRLVCRRGGVVLDPFCGSGSTGVACMREGMRFVGVEREEHYCDIAQERISKAYDECKQQSLPI